MSQLGPSWVAITPLQGMWQCMWQMQQRPQRSEQQLQVLPPAGRWHAAAVAAAAGVRMRRRGGRQGQPKAHRALAAGGPPRAPGAAQQVASTPQVLLSPLSLLCALPAGSAHPTRPARPPAATPVMMTSRLLRLCRRRSSPHGCAGCSWASSVCSASHRAAGTLGMTPSLPATLRSQMKKMTGRLCCRRCRWASRPRSPRRGSSAACCAMRCRRLPRRRGAALPLGV